MDLSLIIMIGGSVAIALALIFCFFGYKLARILLPICGLAVFEAAIYLFIYDLFEMDTLMTWLFFGGSIAAIYIVLFFLKRIAGFFNGLLGSALMLLYVVYALNLHDLAYLYPICLTICTVAGLLTVVYKKVAVIIFTSLFGACTAAFLGLYIYFEGINVADFIAYRNVLVPIEQYLSANAYIVAGVSLGLTIVSIFIQVYATSHTQVLSGKPDDRGFKLRVTKHDNSSDRTYSWLDNGDNGDTAASDNAYLDHPIE
ncbi:MAG: DUF4203 domain-containing protein [Christensenellales bacterium]|jgi:hypothetical protein